MIKTTLVATAMLAATAALPAAAAPLLHAPSPAKAATNSTVLVQQFKYRQGRAWRNRDGRRHWRHRRHRDGVGVGGLVLGAITAGIIADAISEGRASDGDRRACADRYRSFDWNSGTYTGYDGNTYVCPYLR